MEHDTVRYIFDTGNDFPFFVISGVASRYQHDGNSRSRIDFKHTPVKISLRYAFEQIDEIAFDTEHHHFGLGVAHTHVILDNHRLVFYIDES